MSLRDKGYKVASVIICDDIRQERSGKEIIIGVYTGSLIFGQFPATVLRLLFRIAVDLERSDFKRIKARIVDQNNKQIYSMDQPIDMSSGVRLDEPMIFGFAVSPATFTEPSRYRVLFALDGEPEEVASFNVRPPASDEEAIRLK